MKLLYSFALVILSASLPIAFAEGPAVAFGDLKLFELKGNAEVTILKDIHQVDNWGASLRLNSLESLFLYFNKKNHIIRAGSKYLIQSVELNEPYLVFDLDNKNVDPLTHMAIFKFRVSVLSVNEFNSLLSGKIRIEPLTIDEESIPLNKFSIPAKLKIEEDIRVGVLEDTITFKHPTNPNTHIKIKLKNKLAHARVFPKGKTFEVNNIVFDVTTGTTHLTLDSKDIAAFECVKIDGGPFKTKDFYEIMGSKASLIQNTDPPLPIN